MDETVTIHMLAGQSPSQMMSFILVNRGRIVVIDGGTQADAEHLLDKLREVGGEKPEIDVWFLTHPHNDHIDAFLHIMRERPDCLRLKRVSYNFPGSSFLKRYETREAHTIETFEALLPSLQNLSSPLAEGQRIRVGDMTFDILYVHDPRFTMNACNNSSSVIRMEAGGKSVLFLGDLGEEAGDALLEGRGAKALKADLCQMAHHGQSGVKRSFYEAVNPSVCLWCTPAWLWNNDAGQGYGTGPWRTLEVRGWMEEMGVKHHYVSKDGDHTIDLATVGEDPVHGSGQ